MDDDRDTQVAAVAALAEPTRRRLYDHVVRQPRPVGRDEAAEALDLPRATAAFHLDRLVADGLLDVHYERRTGRTGPGAGRPTKLYRRAECAVSVSLPERRYYVVGELLAEAVTEAQASGEPAAAALGGVVTLINCPFHALARTHTELVCGMNLRLLDGVLDGVADSGLAAELAPAP